MALYILVVIFSLQEILKELAEITDGCFHCNSSTTPVCIAQYSHFGINTAVVPAPIENFFIPTILYLLAL